MFPLGAVVTDSGRHNRGANVPVTFTVTQGGGNLNGTVTQLVNTDSNGRALAMLTLGSQPGNGNNVSCKASFSGESWSARGIQRIGFNARESREHND